VPQQTSIAAELVGDASTPLSNILPVLEAMRMIKSPLETEIMRQVGQIAEQ
jgi:Xaa-Pro aminopeptidase